MASNRLRCYINTVGVTNALGAGSACVLNAMLRGDTSGMKTETGWTLDVPARVGKVHASLPPVPSALAEWDCRNNRLLLSAAAQLQPQLDQALEKFGRGRIGVVIGTSTSGIVEGERAVASRISKGDLPAGFHYAQQEIGSAAPFLARSLDLHGPAYTVSTACTSSAKALVSARRLLQANVCDAVVAGGADTLCRLTINGFAALESASAEPTNPMSRNRRGINIGEAAALFLLSREPSDVELLGVGESSDAYHISAPDPDGIGAEIAIRAALADADVRAQDIAYVNLHATATPKNDAMESTVMARVFPNGVPCSGTKPMTGHTLGAAGATEAALCWLAMTEKEGLLPPHIWDGEADPALPPLRLAARGDHFPSGQPRICLSNSFAFGGSNVALILGPCH